ncbi:hypothetical protein [Litchfieldia alkalitelluris]|nr:hypothetical protein [Litchfieldia alkalitelluris]
MNLLMKRYRAMDLTESQVKVTLHRARKKLQQLGISMKGEEELD